MRKLVGTIDLTPTWTSLVPVILAAIENGTPHGVKMAKQEIYKMAEICDAYVVLQKSACECQESCVVVK